MSAYRHSSKKFEHCRNRIRINTAIIFMITDAKRCMNYWKLQQQHPKSRKHSEAGLIRFFVETTRPQYTHTHTRINRQSSNPHTRRRIELFIRVTRHRQRKEHRTKKKPSAETSEIVSTKRNLTDCLQFSSLSLCWSQP